MTSWISYKISTVAEMGDRLATVDIRRKLGACPFSAGPHLTQCRLGQGLPSGILNHPAVWPQRRCAENGGCAPFWGELGPHLTQYTYGPKIGAVSLILFLGAELGPI